MDGFFGIIAGTKREGFKTYKAVRILKTLTAWIITLTALIMVEAGFNDAGPDASDPTTYTWGMNALLTGPDPDRLKAAQAMGNEYGFTDRLDYIFTKNGIDVTTSQIIGFKAPYATDHAGVFAVFSILNTLSGQSAPLDSHKPFPISFWQWVGIVLLALIIWRIVRRLTRA